MDNSDFHSIITLQVAGCDFQYGPNFGVPSDPTMRFRCFFRLCHSGSSPALTVRLGWTPFPPETDTLFYGVTFLRVHPLPAASSSHLRQKSSSRSCSIIRSRKTWSRKNRSWIPLKRFLMHLFFKLWTRWYSVSLSFPISVAMRSSLLDYVFWNRKKVQRKFNETSVGCNFFQEMPACAIDEDRHSMHCVLGSVSTNSISSTLPTSWIIFFDVVLNGWYHPSGNDYRYRSEIKSKTIGL